MRCLPIIKSENHENVWEDTDYHMIIIPPSHPKSIMSLKNSNESVDRKMCVQSFNKRLKDHLYLEDDKTKTRFTVNKLQDDKTMITFSSALHDEFSSSGYV